MTNAQARWPAVRFRIENTAVQGALAVPQIVDALGALDRDPDVDVIVLARGGGSVEDLLPFSDETLCRAVAACRTPVVSAIGHEPDTPLVDHVADVRCSTPTEAGRRLVPDVAEETARIAGLRDRARRALGGWVDREQHGLATLRAARARRPAAGDRRARRAGAPAAGRPARRRSLRGLDRRAVDLEHVRARLTALGPAATLARGYAIVQRVDRRPGAAGAALGRRGGPPGDRLRVRVADGAVGRYGGSVVTRTGPDVDDLGYEQARDELAEVVRKLEAGGLSLDDAVALWERGEALARRCEEQLAGARERVQKVLDAAEGDAAGDDGATG